MARAGGEDEVRWDLGGIAEALVGSSAQRKMTADDQAKRK